MEHPALLGQDQREKLRAFFTSARSGVSDDATLVSYLADAYRLGTEAEAWRQVNNAYLGDFFAFETKAKNWLLKHGYLK